MEQNGEIIGVFNLIDSIRDKFKNSSEDFKDTSDVENFLISIYKNYLPSNGDLNYINDCNLHILDTIISYIAENELKIKKSEGYILSVYQQGLASFFLTLICYYSICLTTDSFYRFIMYFLPENFQFISPSKNFPRMRKSLEKLTNIYGYEDLALCSRKSDIFIIFGILCLNLYEDEENDKHLSEIYMDKLLKTSANVEIVRNIFYLQSRARSVLENEKLFEDQLVSFINICGFFLSKILMTKNGLRIFLTVFSEIEASKNMESSNSKIVEINPKNQAYNDLFKIIFSIPKQIKSLNEYGANIANQIVEFFLYNNYEIAVKISQIFISEAPENLRNPLIIEIFEPLLKYGNFFLILRCIFSLRIHRITIKYNL